MQLEELTRKSGASLVKIPFRHMPRSHTQTNRPISYLLFVKREKNQSPQEVPRIFSFPSYSEGMAFTCILLGSHSHHNSGQQKRSTQWGSDNSASGPIPCSSIQKHWATTAQDFNVSWWVLHKTSERTGLKVNLHKCHSQPDTNWNIPKNRPTTSHKANKSRPHFPSLPLTLDSQHSSHSHQ